MTEPRKNSTIQIRVTDEDRSKYKEVSARFNMKVAQWIRHLVEEEIAHHPYPHIIIPQSKELEEERFPELPVKIGQLKKTDGAPFPSVRPIYSNLKKGK